MNVGAYPEPVAGLVAVSVKLPLAAADDAASAITAPVTQASFNIRIPTSLAADLYCVPMGSGSQTAAARGNPPLTIAYAGAQPGLLDLAHVVAGQLVQETDVAWALVGSEQPGHVVDEL